MEDKITLNDIEAHIEGAYYSGEELRGPCPLCGSRTGFCATEIGDKLMAYCHACNAKFGQFVKHFQPATTYKPPTKTKPKRTPGEAAKLAQKMWAEAKPANPDNSYLSRKGIQPQGLKQGNNGKLIVPARDIYGDITTLQFIDDEGGKRFLSGGVKKGSFYTLNGQTIDPGGIIYIAEGFATAASVQQATGKPTICAFDAGNLQQVAEALQSRYPDAEIVICGDDDRGKQVNKGREAATAAAFAVGGKVCFPSFKSDEDKPTDFNDLHQREGLEAVRVQVDAAMKPEAESIKSVCPLSPAPVEVFPAEIQGLIHRAVETFGTTVEVVIGALLAICSGLIGRRRLLQVKADWLVHAALYLLIVADTGDSKSPPINWLMQPVEALERRWLQDYRNEMALYEVALADYTKGDDLPKKPTRKQIKVGDVTIEKKADVLEANPGGIIEFRDEASGLIADEDKYHGAKGSDRSKHLEIYDRRPFQVDRKSGPPVYVSFPSLARFGSIQPKVLLGSFSDQDAAAGVLGRFICIHSKQTKPAFWSEQTMTAADGELWRELVNRLVNYDMPEDENGWCNGRTISFSNEAKALYIDYYNELAALPYTDGSAIKEILPKAREHCLRLCLILHCLTHATTGTNELKPVTADTMQRTIILARWVYAHNVKTWQMICARVNAPEQQPIEKRIAQAIIDLQDKVSGGVLLTADIAEKVNAGYPEKYKTSSDSIGRVCSGKLKLRHPGNTSKRGWLINPEVVTRLKTGFSLETSALSALSALSPEKSTSYTPALEKPSALSALFEEPDTKHLKTDKALTNLSACLEPRINIDDKALKALKALKPGEIPEPLNIAINSEPF